MEHIISSNISKHHNKCNAPYELQHGFREKRSCETQFILLVEDPGRQLTLGKQTDLVLLDFSKASNKVNHLKLLYKLACFGYKRKHIKVDSVIFNRSHSNCCTGWGVFPVTAYPRGLYWAQSIFYCT